MMMPFRLVLHLVDQLRRLVKIRNLGSVRTIIKVMAFGITRFLKGMTQTAVMKPLYVANYSGSQIRIGLSNLQACMSKLIMVTMRLLSITVL